MLMSTSRLLFLIGLMGTSVAAQPALQVSPRTLSYTTPSSASATIENATGQPPVVLDSVAIRFQDQAARAWFVQFTTPDSTFEPASLNPFYETSIPVGLPLGPGEAATVRLEGLDPCVVCSGGSGGTGGFGPDTLVLYSAGSAIPDTALIDLSGYVTIEPVPPPFLVTLGPNPTAGSVTINAEGAPGADVLVVDVRGRVVTRQRLDAGGSVSLPDRGLAPGPYSVVVTRRDGSQAVRRLTVVR